jgi:hypothetical protein
MTNETHITPHSSNDYNDVSSESKQIWKDEEPSDEESSSFPTSIDSESGMEDRKSSLCIAPNKIDMNNSVRRVVIIEGSFDPSEAIRQVMSCGGGLVIKENETLERSVDSNQIKINESKSSRRLTPSNETLCQNSGQNFGNDIGNTMACEIISDAVIDSDDNTETIRRKVSCVRRKRCIISAIITIIIFLLTSVGTLVTEKLLKK